MATTEDVNAAVDVYLEETADGLYLYAMVGGEKKYMNMVINNQYVNAVYEDAPTSVYVYDETLKTLVTGINNSKYAFGTYNSHTTIGTGDVIKYPDNFFCGFYTSSTDDETPDVLNTTGDVNDDGYTNNRDLAVLMQFINGWEITVNLSVADVNGDGEINNRDYAVLMQFVNGWNVKSV